MFWDLIEKSVIVSGTIALMMVFTVCYISIIGQPIPDVLSNALGVVIGFFFGAKVSVQPFAKKG